MSSKRPRTSDSSQPSAPNRPLTLEPTSKIIRTYPSSSAPGSSSTTMNRPLLCTLPPTCNPPHHNATQIADSKELEMHYAKYHAHVCEQRGCGYVFPDARLLELHQTECHDPLAAVRKERGEKIFACLVASCNRMFLTPKARRLHLIQAHEYPKEFFFAVTNKGVGGLLKRWGDGASMIRGTWKPRENGANEDQDKDDESNSDEDEDSDMDEDDSEDEGRTPRIGSFAELKNAPNLSNTASSPLSKRGSEHMDAENDAHSTTDVDNLAQSITSLTLVPPSIRFGRGGKNGGFVHPELHTAKVAPNTGPNTGPNTFGPRGGRGRARIAHVVQPHANGHTGRGGSMVATDDAPHAVADERSYRGRGGGAPRGFAPRGSGRGGIINIRGGTRGRGRGVSARGS